MHDALGDAFMVEMGDLLAENEIFEQAWAASPLLSEFWLSEIAVPWLVVSHCSGPPAFWCVSPPLPVFARALVPFRVLSSIWPNSGVWC
jgi:hypothetical protein